MSRSAEWKAREMERRVQVEMNRCVHFTGIGNKTCNAGVNYREMIGGPDLGWAKHLPCLADDGSSVVCAHAQFPSETEARADVDRREARTVEFLEQIAAGTCPTCKIPVRQTQVGHCVYGSCGHRLYQGKVDPKFAEQGAL